MRGCALKIGRFKDSPRFADAMQTPHLVICHYCESNENQDAFFIIWSSTRAVLVCSNCIAELHTITAPLSILVQSGVDTKMTKCEKCNEEIPQERLEALPNTKFCVKCSQVEAYGASMHDGQVCIARTEEEKRRQGLHYT